MADEEDLPEEELSQEDSGPAAEEGAEGEEGAGEEGEGSEGGGDKKKLLIIVGGVVVLLVAVGAGLFFTGMLDSLLGKKEACVEEVDEHGEVIHACPEEPEEEHAAAGEGHGGGGGGGHGEAGGGGDGAFLEIPPMLVNLNTDDGTQRYLRLSVQLELEDPADKPKIEAVIPRVIDQFQTYLRELRIRDLRGSAGIYRLQMELLWRVNQASPVEVKDVLFQEILIQ